MRPEGRVRFIVIKCQEDFRRAYSRDQIALETIELPERGKVIMTESGGTTDEAG